MEYLYESEFVKFYVEDHIGVVTIDRPPVNAVCESIRLAITEIFTSLNTRTDVYCVILRAEGRMFTAGHDLKEAAQRNYDPEFLKRVNPTINASFDAVYRCRVPVVAAVHGRVIGMGFAYASLSDVVVASDDALFSFPEITVGTVGGPFWLKRVVPDKVARYHFYTATPFTAEEMKKNHSELPHGGNVIRTGVTGKDNCHTQVIEYKLSLDSNPEFTGSVLVTYARAVCRMAARKDFGCKTVFDVAPADLSIKDRSEIIAHML
jgi:hypothetical protein